jgi:hypothetical protein
MACLTSSIEMRPGMENEPMETEHSFAIVAAGSAVGFLPDESLHLDDAYASIRDGRIHFEFLRRAPSIDEAISSALDDVLKAGLKVIRVDT